MSFVQDWADRFVCLYRYGHTAIIAMDAAALRRVRGKTRVQLTRFLARALLCPFFSQDWTPPKGAPQTWSACLHVIS